LILSASLLVIAAGSLLDYISLRSSPSQNPAGCSSNSGLSSLTAGQSSGLLSKFPVTCIQITGVTNGSIELNGLVYVAENSAEQAQGFMNATDFGSCNGFANGDSKCVGMLFNFSSYEEQCFWMHDTKIPLQQDWVALMAL
jgi:hypothetical protein